MNIVANEYVK